MGVLNNTLKMLFILKTNKIIKAKDIAKQLEVTEQQIRRYKEVLDEYFYIESIPGKNGGYKLNDEGFFPFKGVLTQGEVSILKEFIYGLDSNYLSNNSELMGIIEKINFNILDGNDDEQYDQIIPYSRVDSLNKEIHRLFNEIYLAILENKVLIIKYKDNYGKVSERKVEPYQFITYKGEKYLVAFCLLRNDVRFFKLKRIISFIKTSHEFEKKVNVKEIIKEYKENSIGIFAGKEYDVKLEIKYPMANTIKERIWVENQVIDDTSYEDRIIFTAKMKGGPEIESWILSMGECVKIIEPVELKGIIHIRLENMVKNM